MQANENDIVRFMQVNDVQFFIPVYQRNYDWKNEHCKQLLSDIKKAGLDGKIHSHFIGSIVYLQGGNATSPILTIIDGQQRLTTLTLFVSALANLTKENDDLSLHNKLTKKFLINEYSNDDEKLKLKPIKKDNNALKFVVGNSQQQISEYSRIIENYSFFKESISYEEIEIYFKGFEKLKFIEIALEQGKDDPQKIFQSLNSTGLDLSQADLIRNFILIGLKPKDQLDIYENYWLIIEQNTTENSSKINRTSEFVRDYLTFKIGSIPNFGKVFDVFKDKFQFETIDYLKEVLDELKEYSKFYNCLINTDDELDNDIRQQLKLLKKLQINVAYPFILQVYKTYSDRIISKSEYLECLEIIQAFVWRRFMVSLPTNALNKIFMDLFKSIKLNDFINSLYSNLLRKKGTQRFPNNDEVLIELKSKDMYNIQPKNRTYFLERLENFNNPTPVFIEGNDKVSIEHIFPKNPNDDWKNELGEEYDFMVQNLNSAANLTLSAFNSSLSNLKFVEKRDMPDKGYKYSNLKIDKELANFDKWNIENYNKRLDFIKIRFLKIWKFPDIQINDDNDYEEKNILDYDPSEVIFKSIDYFTFFDEKFENKNWTDLLSIVSNIMFDLEPEQFVNSTLGFKLKFTNDQNSLLRPLKISNNYFIESNLGSKDIVKRVQWILEQCEKDDDLILKIKNN